LNFITQMPNQSRSSESNMHSHSWTHKFNGAACDTIAVRMTPDKRALIKAFVENKGMLEAIKGVLLEGITPLGFDRFISTLDRTIPDAEYGQQVKMRAEAADLLEKGFAQLTKVANAPQGVQSSEKNSSR
jgi:hypothetical protein